VTDIAGGDPYEAPMTGWNKASSNTDPEFGAMIDGLRRLQDAVTAAAPPPEVSGRVAKQLESIVTALEPYAVDEWHQITGHRQDLPGRGQTMSPPVTVEEWDADHMRGRVTISRFFLGGGGAAHGGVPPLVWDEVLGRLANSGGRNRSRTAYLHVDYRSITPIGVELWIEAGFDRVEGRKRFLSGRMWNGEELCSEAQGLFIELRHEQP
jgi:acyl-coenzyme A thioesterase PaaI-like protein